MKRISNLIIHGCGFVDLSRYDRVEELFDVYPDHSEMHILFYKNDVVVRRLWNCPVDVEYAEETPDETEGQAGP